MKRFYHSVYRMVHSVLLVSALVVTGACERQDAKQGQSTGIDAAAGKAIAQSQCAGCHGLDGKGVTDDIPHLAAQYAGYLVESLNAYKDGKRTHAALKDMASHMTPEQIQSVAAYYAGLPPIKTGQAQAAAAVSPYEKGKQTAAACANCHAEDGNSSEAGIPSLAGQQPVYFIAAVNGYLEGKRQIAEAKKAAMMSAVSRVDIESMALYYASQTPVQRDAPANGDPVKGEPLSAACGGCHGAHGVSHDPTIPSLASQDPQYLVKATQEYRGRAREQEDMHKVLATIQDADLLHIAAFYAVQEGQPAQDSPVSIEELAAQCDRCHSPGMESAPEVVFPKINGQHKPYLVKALREYRDGERESSTMHKMSLPYSDAIIESLSTLYAARAAE